MLQSYNIIYKQFYKEFNNLRGEHHDKSGSYGTKEKF